MQADSLLRRAAAAHNSALLQYAIDAGASLKSTSREGRTAVMLATMNGNSESVLSILQILLGTGSTAAASGVNHRIATTGITALMLAAQLGLPLVVRLLLEAGASLETRCIAGETAWDKASALSDKASASCKYCLQAAARRHQYLSTVRVLEEAGAVGSHGKGGCMPMPRAVGCNAARFAAQYRSSMACVLPGLISHWQSCGNTMDAWTSRASLIDLLGGDTKEISVQASPDNHIFPAVYRRKADTIRMSAADVADATLFRQPRAAPQNSSEMHGSCVSEGRDGDGSKSEQESEQEPQRIYCKLGIPAHLETGGLPESVPYYHRGYALLGTLLLALLATTTPRGRYDGDAFRLSPPPTQVFGVQPSSGPTTAGETTFWMGSAGVVTPLHFDRSHALRVKTLDLPEPPAHAYALLLCCLHALRWSPVRALACGKIATR